MYCESQEISLNISVTTRMVEMHPYPFLFLIGAETGIKTDFPLVRNCSRIGNISGKKSWIIFDHDQLVSYQFHILNTDSEIALGFDLIKLQKIPVLFQCSAVYVFEPIKKYS
jgi:hypothetical protein